MSILGSIAKGIGHAAYKAADAALNVTDVGFGLVGKAGVLTGKGLWEGSKFVGKQMTRPEVVKAAGEMAGGAALQTGMIGKDVGHFLLNWGEHMFEPIDPEKGLKLTKIGAATFLGAGLIQGISGGTQAYMDDRIGTVDPKKYTETPKIEKEEYGLDNCGATGDLVFALHNNRHG